MRVIGELCPDYGDHGYYVDLPEVQPLRSTLRIS